jgi:hypothetical protein
VNITGQTNSVIFPANFAMQVIQRFKKREVMARTKFKGDMSIAPDLNLGVQIFSRTREETFPALKKYSKVAE